MASSSQVIEVLLGQKVTRAAMHCVDRCLALDQVHYYQLHRQSQHWNSTKLVLCDDYFVQKSEGSNSWSSTQVDLNKPQDWQSLFSTNSAQQIIDGLNQVQQQQVGGGQYNSFHQSWSGMPTDSKLKSISQSCSNDGWELELDKNNSGWQYQQGQQSRQQAPQINSLIEWHEEVTGYLQSSQNQNQNSEPEQTVCVLFYPSAEILARNQTNSAIVNRIQYLVDLFDALYTRYNVNQKYSDRIKYVKVEVPPAPPPAKVELEKKDHDQVEVDVDPVSPGKRELIEYLRTSPVFQVDTAPTVIFIRNRNCNENNNIDENKHENQVEDIKHDNDIQVTVTDRILGPKIPKIISTNRKYIQDIYQEKLKKLTKADLWSILEPVINQQEVMLFLKGTKEQPMCGFSRMMVGILEKYLKSDQYGDFDVFQDDETAEFLKSYSDWPTFPQLYVGGELVGGLDIVQEMDEEGSLEELLVGKKAG